MTYPKQRFIVYLSNGDKALVDLLKGDDRWWHLEYDVNTHGDLTFYKREINSFYEEVRGDAFISFAVGEWKKVVDVGETTPEALG